MSLREVMNVEPKLLLTLEALVAFTQLGSRLDSLSIHLSSI